MQREQKSQIDGYIIKLYKKIVNAPQHAFAGDAMFMTWTNFDCMDVLPVLDFHYFGKSLDANRLKDREKYRSRQKLFIYPIAEDRRLILNDSALGDVPLITVTALDLKKQSDVNVISYEKVLCENIDKCIGDKQNLQGQLYGSLSNYDYVLVLRGNSYAELGQALTNFQKNLIQSGILFNKTYTIEGLDLNHLSSWREEPDSNVSIRLSCTSCITPESFRNSKGLKEALQDGYKVFTMMGKYDYSITGKIKDTQKFIELFKDNGVLTSANTDIHKTNTQFMNLELNDDITEKIKFATEDKLIDDDLERCMERYLELNGLCSSIKESLLRLILRISQAGTIVSRVGMKKDLKNLIYDFLDFLRIHQYESDRQDEFGQIINCINLLLDNRITAGPSDFETPQNVLRYSGANLKVLLAYSAFADKLFSILQLYKQQNNQRLKYVHLVTTDTGAKITATLYLSYCERYRFININIPVDLLFDVQYVLPWITHEVGHFIRAGWKRSERNSAYYWSVSRVMANRMSDYINSGKIPDLNANSMFDLVIDEYRDAKFDMYREHVLRNCQNIITRCVYGYKRNVLIPYNHSEHLLDEILEITSILQKVYEESIADIFMVQVLNIKSLTEYLRIQGAYYNHINVDKADLSLANISRIMAVSVIIEGLDVHDYDQIKNYFRGVYEQYQDDESLVIVKQMKEYKSYFMIEPLVSFLNQKVEVGLKKLLLEDGFSNICEELRKSYNGLKKGSFMEFREFVEGV